MTKTEKQRLVKVGDELTGLEKIGQELHVSGLQTFDELEAELDKLGKDILKHVQRAKRALNSISKDK